jgi:hypothetical protein
MVWCNIVNNAVLTCSAIIISRGTTLKACRVGSTTVLIRRGSEIQDPSLSLSLVEAESYYGLWNSSERIKLVDKIFQKEEDEKKVQNRSANGPLSRTIERIESKGGSYYRIEQIHHTLARTRSPPAPTPHTGE